MVRKQIYASERDHLLSLGIDRESSEFMAHSISRAARRCAYANSWRAIFARYGYEYERAKRTGQWDLAVQLQGTMDRHADKCGLMHERIRLYVIDGQNAFARQGDHYKLYGFSTKPSLWCMNHKSVYSR